MSVYERILVTLDGSLLAERALEAAALLARTTGAELILMRVVTPVELWAPFVEIEPAFEVAQDRHERESAIYLEEVRDRLLEEEESLNIRTVALHGPVAETITDYAHENDIDLIVISSHGRSGLSRWIYGSVAEKVLRSARCCSTLVVRNERARREEKEKAPDAASAANQ